jgi:hypothetical protein
MANSDHQAEVDELVLAVRRNIDPAIFRFDNAAVHRLLSAWDRLCVVDPDVAARIYRSVETLSTAMGHCEAPNSPAYRDLALWRVAVGMAELGRAVNPDFEMQTFREFDEQAVRDEVGRDTES